ncbi:MAG: hypothetical protein ABR498_02560 [Candidatus Dormibacteria bacterium]
MRRRVVVLWVIAGLTGTAFMASAVAPHAVAAPAPDHTPGPKHPGPTPGDPGSTPQQHAAATTAVSPPVYGPSSTPSAAPLQSTAPVPTGPAVGTETTPQGLQNVPTVSVGPSPQPSGGDITLLVLLGIIGLVVTAIGAFVLAIALQ